MGARRYRTAAGRAGTTGAGLPHVDGWLRLDPASAARHEADHGTARAYHLRHIIWFGLVLYNVYIVTGFLLTPDIAWLGAALRALVVTPVSLVLAWAVVHLPPLWRERLTLLAMFMAHLMPVLLFFMTQAPMGSYTYSELTLTLVYGNMLMALRFRHAVVFSVLAVAVTLAALGVKHGMSGALEVALAVQILTAGVFSLSANYLMERRRCHDYVTALTALLRAERAEDTHLHLAEMSQTDPLTGLHNRRFMDDTLAGWCDDPGPVALMMIDVDHFKRYNDTLGHPAGDDCLRQLAQVFALVLPDDQAFCARFGGEEFVVVLREGAAQAASSVAARINAAVRSLHLPHPGRTDGVGIVTLSIGLAHRPSGPITPEALLTEADNALYQAKDAGRDRIVAFTPRPRRAIRSA